MKRAGRSSIVRPRIEVFGGQQQINGYFLKKWAETGSRAIEERGVFFAALPGGDSPAAVFSALGRSPLIGEWDRTHIFLTDERMVPYSHKDSNFRLIAERLLVRIGIPWKNVHPVDTGLQAPEAAAHYERTLRQVFGTEAVPVFDLIILGLGEDGHTASLFPGSPALNEKERLATASTEPVSGGSRVTLTLPVLNSAREVIFLVTGARKAGIVKKVLAEGLDAPASAVKPAGGPVYVLDLEAAGSLDPVEE